MAVINFSFLYRSGLRWLRIRQRLVLQKFTVLENIILGRKEGRFIELPLDEAEKKVLALSETYGLNIRPRAVVEDLTVGEQQRVEIVKALYRESDLLIMDEPTKGIDVGAKYSIYEIMNELACNGYAIIMVSSEMPEVLGVADRVVVMKSGRVTAEFSDMSSLTQEMILEASLKEKGGDK